MSFAFNVEIIALTFKLPWMMSALLWVFSVIQAVELLLISKLGRFAVGMLPILWRVVKKK